MIKVEQLREMTKSELLQKRNELLDERFNLNMRQSLKALDNPLRFRHLRREIAQIDTIVREDQLGIRKLADRSTSILPQDTKKSPKGKDKK